VPFAGQASTIIGPIIVFLLPILIGLHRWSHRARPARCSGRRDSDDRRHRVAFALGLAASGATPPKSIAELGPQFLGALIIGPATLLLKWIDSLIDRLRGGFEMLVDNFTSGIVGGFSISSVCSSSVRQYSH
jgi:PTS system mannitol-specific IIC component